MNEEAKMTTNRKSTKWAGVFYIIATAAPILTSTFIGFLGGMVSGEPIPDFLVNVSAKETQVIIGMFIELSWAIAVVGIIVTLFPTLKKHNEALALGFFGLRFIEAICTIIHSILLLSLLTLSQEFIAAGLPDNSYFQTVGTILLAARDWTFLIGSGLVWSLSALVLNYLLFKGKFIPRWLSVWGFVAAGLSFANYLPKFFGIASLDILFLPIGLQEMVFAVWMIVKGFNSITNDSLPDKTI